MKRYFVALLTAAAFLLPFGAGAQKNVKSIWDVETPFSKILSLQNKKTDDRHPACRKQKLHHKADYGFKNMYVGGFMPYNSAEGIKSSWEIGVANVYAGAWRFTRGFNISLGAGFGYSRLNIGHDMQLTTQDGALILSPKPEDVVKTSGRISNFHLAVPLMFNFSLPGGPGLSIGAEAHLNTYATASMTYTMTDGHSYKSSLKGLHQRFVTPSFVAIFGIAEGIGVYYRVNPVSAWKSANGPDYRTNAVGVSLYF